METDGEARGASTDVTEEGVRALFARVPNDIEAQIRALDHVLYGDPLDEHPSRFAAAGGSRGPKPELPQELALRLAQEAAEIEALMADGVRAGVLKKVEGDHQADVQACITTMIEDAWARRRS
jgi:hypothetical protein